MKEQNNLLCGHCGNEMNIREFGNMVTIDCPKCGVLFSDKYRNSSYSCPTCFSPLLAIYKNFQNPILLCSDPECPAYHFIPKTDLGSGEPCFAWTAFELNIGIILQDDNSLVLLDGGNNGVVSSPPTRKLAEHFREISQNR